MKNFWQNLLDLSRDQEKDLRNLCRVLPFYQDFTPQEKRRLTDVATLRAFSEDELIYEEGEAALAVFFILSGSVGLHKKNRDRDMERYRYATPGDFFGEESLLGVGQRLFWARALENTQLLCLTRPDFETLMKTHPQSTTKMLLFMTRRICFQFNTQELELRELAKRLTQAKIIV